MTPAEIAQLLSSTLLSREKMVQAGRYLAEGFYNSGNARSMGQAVAGGRERTDTKPQETVLQRKQHRNIVETIRNEETELKVRKLLNKQYAEHSTLLKNLDAALSSVSPMMQGFTQDMSRIGDVMQSRFQAISDTFETFEEEAEFWKKIRKKTVVDIHKMEQQRLKLLRALQSGNLDPAQQHRTRQNLLTLETERAKVLEEANKLKEQENKKISSLLTRLISWGALLEGLRRLSEDVQAQLKYGTSGSILSQQHNAIKLLGVDPAMLSEMSAQARMAEIAMGGHDAAMQAITKNQWELFKVTGSFAEAARHQMESFQILGEAGIRPTMQDFRAMQDQMDYLHRMVGMTAEQYRALNKRLVDDVDIRQRLAGLNMQQRHQVLQEIRQRIIANTALGMTAEQAEAAAKALEKMTGEGPKERFKRAAQLQMLGGMLGIAGTAEAAEALRLGDRATAEQRAALDRVSKAITDARARSRQGALGMEFAIDSVLSKTGLDEAFGKTSPFLTTMTEALRPDPEVAQATITTAQNTSFLNENLLKLITLWEAGKGIAASSALGPIVAGALGVVGGPLALRGIRGAWNMLRGGASAAGTAVRGASGRAIATMGTRVGAIGAGSVLGAGLAGYTAGTYGYKAIDHTRFGIAISEFTGRLTDAIKMRLGVDEEGVEERMRQRADVAVAQFREDQARQAAEQRALQERMLAAQEQANELTKIQIEMTQGLISSSEAAQRISRLMTMGQTTMLAN